MATVVGGEKGEGEGQTRDFAGHIDGKQKLTF